MGDWGKQFGMLIVAYKKWGDEEAVKAHPIDELLKLYVRINAEAENDPSLDEEAREWFRKLENETRKLSLFGNGSVMKVWWNLAAFTMNCKSNLTATTEKPSTTIRWMQS